MRNFLLMLLIFPCAALGAGDFPTSEAVRMVVTCMAQVGGHSEENLASCSCRHDYLASKMPFRDYEQADMVERYRNMPGKRGALFRDSEAGEKLVEKMTAVRKEAEQQCPLVKHIEPPKKSADGGKQPQKN